MSEQELQKFQNQSIASLFYVLELFVALFVFINKATVLGSGEQLVICVCTEE